MNNDMLREALTKIRSRIFFSSFGMEADILGICDSALASTAASGRSGKLADDEPVAWAIFAENENCRVWFGNPESAMAWARNNGGQPVTPLYTRPATEADSSSAAPSDESAAEDAVPVGVCFSESRCDFYAADSGYPMGAGFYDKWRDRADDFPDRDTARAALAALAALATPRQTEDGGLSAAAVTHCATCERNVTGPCSSADCSTPDVIDDLPLACLKHLAKCHTHADDGFEVCDICDQCEEEDEPHAPDCLASRARDFLASTFAPKEPAAQGGVPGWQLVPVEPTSSMVEAPFVGMMEDQDLSRQIKRREAMAENYRKMLAASPAPTGASK